MNQEILEKINQRRRQILVHSCIYYRMGEQVISDYQFDKWAYELVDLQNNYPEESRKGVYYDFFVHFDGSTGFDLPTGNPEIYSKALQVLNYSKKR